MRRPRPVLKAVLTVAAATVLAAVVFVYAMFDPSDSLYWPKCPFHLLTGLELPTKSGRRIQPFGLRLTHFPLQLDIMCEKIILVTRILTVSILIFDSRNRQMTDPHQQRIGLRQHASSAQYRKQQQ